MRTIKFRAWDEANKRMIDSVGFTDSDAGRRWQRETAMVDDYANFSSSYWIPMQFTGLLDKNGKEIWEGDVVSYGVSEEARGEIIYSGDSFTIYNLHAPSLAKGQMIVEVIGNIYENPGLLSA